jgi:hypothetical protein
MGLTVLKSVGYYQGCREVGGRPVQIFLRAPISKNFSGKHFFQRTTPSSFGTLPGKNKYLALCPKKIPGAICPSPGLKVSAGHRSLTGKISQFDQEI